MLTPQNLSLNRLALVLLPCPAQEEDPSLIPPLACLSSLEFLAAPIDEDEEKTKTMSTSRRRRRTRTILTTRMTMKTRK